MAISNFSHTSMGNIVEVDNPQNPGLPGNRNNNTLQEAFPGSPVYSQLTDDSIKQSFKKLVEQGPVKNPDGAPVAGFGFSAYNRDFVDSPDVPSVETDNEGENLVSPFAPNVSSPDETATRQENEVVPNKGSGSPFRGEPLRSPRASSADISSLTIGSYGLGTSSPRS